MDNEIQDKYMDAVLAMLMDEYAEAEAEMLLQNSKAKSSIIEQLSRKKKEIAEREVSRTDQAKSKKQDMEL